MDRFGLGTSCLALAVLAAAVTHAAEPAGGAAAIMAKVKEETGGAAWDAIKTDHVTGKLATGGMNGTVESWDDVVKGRFVDRVVLGPVTQAQGYDGQVVWSQDSSGQVNKAEGGDEKEGTANEAYRRSLSYWYKDRRPGSMEDAGTREEGGRSFQVVRITPRDGRPFDVWIDAQTHLVDHTVEKAAMETRTTYLSDYRAIAGVKVPFAVRSTNGETKYDQFITLDSIEFNRPVEEAAFAMPAPPPPDYRFASGKTSTTVPFELVNNHIYVQVKLNGQGPFRLLCDTGGANIVTPELAQKLGLKTEGALQGRGVGEKSEDVGLTKIKTTEVGDVTLENQVFAVYPLGPLSSAEGIPSSGLIGYEVFKRFVVRVDYEKTLLTLTDPPAYTPAGKGTVVPFKFNGHIPQVEGSIDGLPGKFDIDTGSRASLSLLAPFAEKNKLKERYAARVEGVTGWGVGGAARSQVTRAKDLRLGDVKVVSPVTEISLQSKGAFTDPYVAGNVGAGVLKRFNITFDYRSQTLTFEPNSNDSRPDIFDRSGMWINHTGSTFEVIDVIKDGPAAQAALRAGDRIVTIDGKTADEVTLPGLRARFKTDEPGTKIHLKVQSGDATREVVLTLKDLV
jgi:aspartyl protease/PDZ domain-containing protein